MNLNLKSICLYCFTDLSCFIHSAFNVHEWGTEEVAQWLDSLGLAEYRDGFIRNDIRGPELLHLERRDLKVTLYCSKITDFFSNLIS